MGHADLPQQAKHNASVQALPYLNQMPDIKPPSKAAAIPKNSQSKKETETASMTKEGKNVIMVLNEIAMQQQVCIDWNIVDEDGPPHMRAFTYTLKMGSYEVSFFLSFNYLSSLQNEQNIVLVGNMDEFFHLFCEHGMQMKIIFSFEHSFLYFSLALVFR